ncbi:hypothetical protein ACEQ8H_002058 [Pleosporales sp. CAS-2024a]
MPSVAQFPPARVFLKHPSLTMSSSPSAARASTLKSPLSPRYANSSSATTSSFSQITAQRSSETATSASRRYEARS